MIIGSIVFLIFLFFFILLKVPMLIRFYPKLPEFENKNMKWYSSVNDFTLQSVYKEQDKFPQLIATVSSSSGTIILDCDVSYGGQLQFWYGNEGLVMCADCNINEDGNIQLKNIEYGEKIDWDKTPKRITLQRQATKE